LLEQAKEATCEDEIPFALRNRPVLNQFQVVYWVAFQELTDSRQYTSAGIAGIPYIPKIAWLDENGIVDPDDRRDYLRMISVLDSVFTEHHYEKSKVK
jgi:hypothetical protein